MSRDERLIQLVREHSNLTDEDVAILLEVSHTLKYISALEKADAFIDIQSRRDKLAIVVAQHSPPESGFHDYCIIGDVMWRADEPGVYRTLEVGIPTRELKAIAHERDGEVVVKQNISPITNTEGKVIGALIVEKRRQQSRDKFYTSQWSYYQTVGLNNPSSEELQSIAESIGDAVIIFDKDGTCTYANGQAQKLFRGLGYQDDLVGLAFENISFSRYTFTDLKNNPESVREHNEIKIGSYNLKLTCNSIYNNDRFRGALLVIRDRTEEKHKETQLILKSVAIDEIHHRVKNNLQTIISLIGLQANRSDSEEVKTFSHDIISRIYSISMTHEILARKGVDSVEIKELLSKMLDSSVNYIVPQHLDLNFEITGDEILLASSLATTIAIVVNELIQNSIKHAFIDRDKGRVEITVAKGRDEACITINDNGVGFGEEQKNSSLGLKLVRSLVKEKLKGDIEFITGDDGTFATFTFITNKSE